MVCFDEVGMALYIDRYDYSSLRLKGVFSVVDSGFHHLGVTPTHLLMRRIGVRARKAGTYKRQIKAVQQSEFTDVEAFTIRSSPCDRTDIYRSYRSQACATHDMRLMLIPEMAHTWRELWAPSEEHDVCSQFNWVVFTEDCGVSEEQVLSEMHTVARSTADYYGYIAWLRRGTEPTAFDWGLGVPGVEGGHTWSPSLSRGMAAAT